MKLRGLKSQQLKSIIYNDAIHYVPTCFTMIEYDPNFMNIIRNAKRSQIHIV